MTYSPDQDWDKATCDSYELVISPSQLVDYLACPRKWMWSKIWKMPRKPQKDLHFGTIVHAVWERWLNAPDNGRGADLYPAGWAYDAESGNTLNATEQARVKSLTDAAIKAGVLRRLPGRKVEDPFMVEVTPEVLLRGKIDQWNDDVVEDHKTTKKRKYILSQESLAEDPKMLCYALHDLCVNEKDKSTIRLNYVVKDPDDPFTKPVQVTVPAASVWDFLSDQLRPAAEGMLELARAEIPEAEWATVVGPTEKGHCSKYGGCAYADVCSGIRSPKSLRTINDRLRPKHIMSDESSIPPWHLEGCKPCEKTPGISKTGAPCGACDLIQSRNGGPTSKDFDVWTDDEGSLCWAEKGKGPKGKVAPAKAAAAPVKAPAPAPRPTAGKAPLVKPATSKPATAPTKTVTPARKPVPPKPIKKVEEVQELEEGAEVVDVEAEELARLEAEMPEGDQTPSGEEVNELEGLVTEEDLAAEEPAPVKRGPGRPKKVKPAPEPEPEVEEPADGVEPYEAAPEPSANGFILYLNCTPINEQVVDAAVLFASESAKLAVESQNPAGYYAMKPFERLDFLRRAAEAIAGDLSGKHLVAANPTHEVQALVEALRPYATFVVQGF